MQALIVCAGNKPSNELFFNEYKNADIKIAVDGGSRVFYEHNLLPDILLGDMDSLDEHIISFFASKGVEIRKFRPEKDLTDTAIAVEYIIEEKFSEAVLLGCTGSRFDHQFANLVLLKKMHNNNIQGIIKDNNNDVFLINNNKVLKKTRKYVSFFALSEKVTGLTLDGFKYPLRGYELLRDDILCTSNEITHEWGNVEFEQGELICICSDD
ncbi:thiamine diphosphokinase [Oceanirhabdus sp. W0125-5]|uniref:thiamine diphosphokinase n=1 Tax=Oceanirhabdus sp. W0125-5 TaxID=2999116 RepID=UPI0022F33211|nr:thiamine diphosphokinase [Oceanirhabdus sp. W0125-5]WBW94788.1 thiamine diphosphokinase [Oceanirhabdus sp. W0125-5]